MLSQNRRIATKAIANTYQALAHCLFTFSLTNSPFHPKKQLIFSPTMQMRKVSLGKFYNSLQITQWKRDGSGTKIQYGGDKRKVGKMVHTQAHVHVC